VLTFLLFIILFFFNPATILGQAEIPPESIIIKFKDGTVEAAKQKVFSQTQTTRTGFVSSININTATFTGDLNETVNTLNSYSEVEYAEPDYIRTLSFTPNDPQYGSQYFLKLIKADKAWDLTHGSSTVYVADVDTGISPNHPDLIGKIAKTKNYSTDEIMNDFKCPHGTAVAGVFGAATNNSVGVASVGFDTQIIAAKLQNVVTPQGCGVATSALSAAIHWVVDNGASVINLSIGGYKPSQTEQEAVDYATNKGTLVVAAAGNENTDKITYPANYTDVLSVAATDKSDGRAGFSNYGSWVDIAAPGVDILTTFYDYSMPQGKKNTYISADGTSLSSPIVAGVATLVKAKNPNLTNTQISNILCQTADKIGGTGEYWRCGRVNAYAAVLAAGGGGEPTPNPTPTSTPSATDLIVKIRFQGIDVAANSQLIILNIYQNGAQKITVTQETSSNSDGTYDVRLTNPQDTLIPGTVAIKIKGPSHLRRSVTSIIYTGPGTTIDLTQNENQILLAGDTTNDNKITIEDLSNISRYYTDFSVAVDNNDASMKSADITKNGFITIQDLALASINWSDLAIKGDE